MKRITKLLVAPLLLGIFALSSCSGGLKNEKEVTEAEFAAKVVATPANTYTVCDEKGYSIVNEGEELKSEYSTRLKWDGNNKTWDAPLGATYFPVTHVSLEYVEIIAQMKALDIRDGAHFYIGDNGFRLTCNANKSSVVEGMSANATLNFEYIWNEYGYPVSIKTTLDETLGTMKSSQKVEVSFTYSNSN